MKPTVKIVAWMIGLCLPGTFVEGAEESQTPAAPNPWASDPSTQAVKNNQPVIVTEKPATIEIKVNDDVRNAIRNKLASGDSTTLRMFLQGVMPRAGNGVEPLGLQLFLNKPDADAATPQSDPHHIGRVSFQPTVPSGPQGFLVDWSRSVVELARKNQLDLTKPLTVTFVLIPDSNAPKTPGSTVSIADVTVSAAPRKK